MKTTKTTKLGSSGIEYAKVADRLQEFWADNPHGKITTEPMPFEGQISFRCHILTDKSDPNSKEATGHTLGTSKNAKDFEKLESIAVGRALALIGYAASGEIASSEEMLEYRKFQEEKRLELFDYSLNLLETAETVKDLTNAFIGLDPLMKIQLKEKASQLKAELLKKAV